MFSHRKRGPQQGSGRSGGRWVGLGAAALLTAGAPLAALTASPMAAAADCADAEVVFARGTDEPAGMGRVGDALVDALRKQTAGMKIDSYGVNYKASKLQLHGGDGAKDAISHIKSTLSSCPDTKIVLGGYSQGASVINIVAGNPLGNITWGDSLPREYADNVVAITTFGDVGTRTKQSIATQSALYGSKAIDLCNPMDPICHEGQGNEWSGHTEGYVPVYTTQAASFIASKLLAGSGQSLPGYGPALPDYGQLPEFGLLPGSGPTPVYGPLPGSGPDTSLHGPQPGYAPAPGYSPQTPGYGTQPPGPDSSTTAPSAPPAGIGWV
ncbi:cutinase family protein [Mycolicibacterium peregrinum]|uniref:cutinase family protein n=1 Tax=Mycolicibacterium peregrinum TaxID=43304 RepID=UPI0006D7D83E|nr:cutinase family protein [Mycolicibacterium peregrinum]MCV7204208.1 cutinase family protein [Mycolicibacterium peregrinum]ORW56468.1 serine esterase [Mycolicibacterium peregrinum]OWM04020.1 cutinase family protein [Mycolicibacterium peregrinum]